MQSLQKKIWGSASLIAGTAIGAGMLSLPLELGAGGSLGATFMLLICFFYMMATLLLLLEILFYQNEALTLAGLARRYLGPVGESVGWFCFLGLLYMASVAYFSGANEILKPYVLDLLAIPPMTISVVLALFLGVLMYLGVSIIDQINRYLMIGLLISFASLVTLIMPHAQLTDISHGHPWYLIGAPSVIVTAFTSHIILPSLKQYLEDSASAMRQAIWRGNLATVGFYLIWTLSIVCALPLDGPRSLSAIALSTQKLTLLNDILRHDLGISELGALNASFSFFAMITSFIGVALALADFLTDGLKLKRYKQHRIISILLALLPPLILLLLQMDSFTSFLRYIGVFIVIQFILIPVCIAWIGRYQLKLTSSYTLPGGKPMLILLVVGALLVILIEAIRFQYGLNLL